VFIFTFDDFDNNYAHNEWNTRILEPRIFTKQPFTMFLQTTGEFQALKYYSLFYRKTPSVEEHYHYDFDSLKFFYDYTADSATFFNMTRFELTKKGTVDINTGVHFKTTIMENALSDSLTPINHEDDKRFHAGIFLNAGNKSWEMNSEVIGGMRNIAGQHDLKYILGFLGATYKTNYLTVKFGEVYNYLESDTIQNAPDSLSRVETRFLVSVVWHISEEAEFSARKGFETDLRDIAKGGRYFFYDKMYVQFHINFDPYLDKLIK